MIDKILHSVTNRTTFASPCFRAVGGFTPITMSPAAAAVHKLLCLDVTTHDYFVQGALAAIDAFPELREGFRESYRSYALRDYQRPQDSWGGITPIGDPQGPFVLRRVPTRFPIDPTVSLTYGDVTTLGVLCDGQQLYVPCSSGEVLFPEWPLELGISGGLELVGQAWDTDFVAHLWHIPISYPYPVVAALLDASADKNQLLLEQGLIEHYTTSRSALEKCATVIAALGLTNLQ